MRWKIWAIIIGIAGAIFSSFLWIILNKSKNTTGTHSKKTHTSDQQKIILQEPTLSHNSLEPPKRNKVISSLRRLPAILLVLVSLGLFLIWAFALITNLLIEPLPNGFLHDQTVPTIDNPLLPPDGVSILPPDRLSSNDPHATLTLTINQIKNVTPSEAILTGTFDLKIPTELQNEICDYSGLTIEQEAAETHCEGRGTVAQLTKDGAVKLKPQYSSKTLNLSISDFFGTDTYKRAIPLSDLFQNPPPPSISSSGAPNTDLHIQIPVSFSLFSQGETYPGDKYWGGAGISIALPGPLYVLHEYPSTASNYLPTDTRVRANTGIGNIEIKVTQIGSNYADNPVALNIDANRTLAFRLQIYLTTIFLTLGFLIFIGHSLFVSNGRTEDSLQNVLLNAFIAILTVVAIRQVLVPPDLQGLITRLDLILAVAATFLIDLIFLRYAIEIWKPTAKNHYD